LADKGFSVVCFDKIKCSDWPAGAKAIVGDFAAPPESLSAELDDCLLFYLVSASRPSASTSKIGCEIAVDLSGTLRLLETIASRRLRLIYFSSGGTVYGHNDSDVIPERSATEPICSYGVMKLTAERYVALYGLLHRLDHVIVRPSNPYGPGQSPLQGQGLIAVLLHRALNDQAIEVWGDGENVRDYIYIDDLAEAAVAAAVSGKNGAIYNIGTGLGHSINQVIAQVRATLGRPMAVSYAPQRAVDVRRNVLCIDRLTTDTEWTPRIGLAEGLKYTAEWIRHSQKFDMRAGHGGKY